MELPANVEKHLLEYLEIAYVVLSNTFDYEEIFEILDINDHYVDKLRRNLDAFLNEKTNG